MFEPFFTGENGRQFSNSSGIGLYLCKRIADKAGQTITIDSAVGKGTTVTVRWIAGAETKTMQQKYLTVL
ncbi:ATP-binding protein [Alkalihalobacillus oceani]|uniref:ATP-binding protein n=1 Tax=Halalkalibacter oceani TaxID=1653776 RepID=UPI00203AB4E1|nr:ATP-binding protein [Halalkalibacter oceani]